MSYMRQACRRLPDWLEDHELDPNNENSSIQIGGLRQLGPESVAIIYYIMIYCYITLYFKSVLHYDMLYCLYHCI